MENKTEEAPAALQKGTGYRVMEKMDSNSSSKSDAQKEENNDLVTSYQSLRNFIGFSGALLPVVLVLFSKREDSAAFMQPSISDYYYTSTGDIFVVLLCSVAVFLLTYNGYSWKEKLCTTVAALAAFGVSFSPTASSGSGFFAVHSLKTEVPIIAGLERHLIFATIFFACIAIMSLVYFPMTKETSLKDSSGKRTAKAKRNIIFKICGWTILLCIIGIAAFKFSKAGQAEDSLPLVFILETIAVEAFALSWLTKGETIFPDGDHYMTKAYKITKNTLSSQSTKKH